MVTVIKKGMRKKEIKALLERYEKTRKRKIDIKKYCGIIDLKEDPLVVQRKLRDEWE